jgi:hypothetical protein
MFPPVAGVAFGLFFAPFDPDMLEVAGLFACEQASQPMSDSHIGEQPHDRPAQSKRASPYFQIDHINEQNQEKQRSHQSRPHTRAG